MIKVGEQGIFISDTAAKKLSPYILSQFKKTLVLDLNALQSFTESDPVFTAWLATPPNVSIFTNDAGYLTSFSETDPIFSLWQSTYDNHADWDTVYGWGNHASAGYLTGITSLNVTTALGYIPYDATNPSGYITSSSLSSYVPTARTLTINGTTYDLSTNRSWTISTGTTYTFSTGLTNIAGTITSNLSTGVSGGQSVVGGTSSGNNLTLSSTSNATKGKILFGTSAYDEVNNRLGVGTNSPSVGDFGSTFTVKGTGSEVGIITAQRNVSAVANGTGFQTVLNNASSNPVTYSYFNGYIITNTAGAESGGLMFYTRNAGTLGARMTILNNGNTGIGTTNPGGILDIYKSDNANPLLMRIWNGGSGGAKLRFVAETGGTAQHQWTTDKFLAAIAANNTIGMQFRVGLNATEAALDASTRMTITTNGKVGIGTTTPTALLMLAAGTATASTAPLKFTSGTNLTTPEAGAVEYDGTELYFTPSTTRYKLGQVTAGSSTIASGTYTPTLTGVTNVTSTTAYVCQYMRVGNVVTVSGKIEVTPTVNNAQTTIGVSLPIASNFANSQECGGAAHSVANTVLGHGAAIYADATNDRAEMDYFETHGASDTFSFSFTYQII